MYRADQLFAVHNGLPHDTVTKRTITRETPNGPIVETYSEPSATIEVHTTCRKPGTARSHFRKAPTENSISYCFNNSSHGRARLGAHRIANTHSSDVWLNGFMRPLDPSSNEAWEKLFHDIRNDCTQGCDVRQECENGAVPLAISYKWQHNQPGMRMSDVQFTNLRNMVSHHLANLRGAKVTLWLDQHMRKNVGDRERNQWLSYGTTAYRNAIVCYLPNVDITGGHPNPQVKIGSEPVDASEAFLSDTSRLWIAFEIRRATQGVGLMCGKGTELGLSKYVILDGSKTMVEMWSTGFIAGGELTNEEAQLQEEGDILSGRLVGVNESWDEFLISEKARISPSASVEVNEIKRYKHFVGGEGETMSETFEFSEGGEYESEKGLPMISICDIGPGQHCTSSYVSVRKVKRGESWNGGSLLLAGDFNDSDKANEVSELPVRRIASLYDPSSMTYRELWIAHVSTKHAEKYCCFVLEVHPRVCEVLELIDIWPIHSQVFDAAVYGLSVGTAGVVAYLGELEVGSEDWSTYKPRESDREVLARRLEEFLAFEMSVIETLSSERQAQDA